MSLADQVASHDQRLDAIESRLSSGPDYNPSPSLLDTQVPLTSYDPIQSSRPQPVVYPIHTPVPPPNFATPIRSAPRSSSPLQQQLDNHGKRVENLQSSLDNLNATLSALQGGNHVAQQQ